MVKLFEMSVTEKNELTGNTETKVLYGWTTANVIDQYWAAYCDKPGNIVTIRMITEEEYAKIRRDMGLDSQIYRGAGWDSDAEGTGDYTSWTDCQFYGHDFVDGHCTNCPEVTE